MPLSFLMFFGILFVLVCMLRAVRIGALVAFLAAGVLSGPYGLNLFEMNQTWQLLGDMGILFLWFNIGLEINMSRLWSMRKTIFGLGASQVLTVAVMLFPVLFGITRWSVLGCIMVALILAMSSTSEDLQLLSDRNELNTNVGNQTFSILLFQDLLSIPILAMLPVFAGKSFDLGATAIDVAVLSLLLIVLVVFVGRFILNPLLKRVIKLKSREALLLTVMLNIVIWATVLDMMGLPVGLGAFLAGMLMSETIYRHQISAEISPYSMLFLAFFFIALGMGLNVPLLLEKWQYVLVGLGGLVFVKFMALFMVSRVRGTILPDATFMALILSQGGEFGLLMLQTMKSAGINAIPINSSEILTAIIILSIMTTPVLLAIYDLLRRRGWIFAAYRPRSLDRSGLEVNPSVVILGFGRVGEIVAKLMEKNGVSYIAIDMDVNAIVRGRENGYNVVFGNCKNGEVLTNFGLHPRKTEAVIIALDNAESAKDALLTVKSIAPRVKVYVRARNLAECKILRKHGAFRAMPETIETAFILGFRALHHMGFSDAKLHSVLNELRDSDYSELDNSVRLVG